jgi:ubiquinone/menaquinone biosynthesis C-methylase UbiE
MTHPAELSPAAFFRAYGALESRLTAAVSERMLDLAGVGPGTRVLDLATGPGEPALRAARRVAPDGLVVGLELDDAILEIAREIAREEAGRYGPLPLNLRAGDAAIEHDLPSHWFDAVTSRWGLMYMSEPRAALANAHRALSPTGVVVAALWAEPERVPYHTLPRRLLERYRSIPSVDVEAPGPFRYATLERIARDFEHAGFALDHVEEMDVTTFESTSDAALIGWVRALGLTRLLDGLPASDQRAWERDLTGELRRTSTDGVLRLGGVTRIVRARKA